MASTRQLTTKDGRIFYEITVSRGRSKARLTKRWYPPDGWSRKAIERELASVAAEFERQSDAGEVVSRAEKRAQEAQEAEENAKILTVRQYGERVFMPAKTVTMSEAGRSNYQLFLDKRIYPVLGDIKVRDVTPTQISSLLLTMQSEGKAHGTVVKLYTILNSFFKMAYRGDAIDRNPMDKVDAPRPRKDELQKPGVNALSVEEIRKIIRQAEVEPLKWRTYIRLMIDTGARRGECCAVRWEDIDFQTGEILIRGNVGYTPQKGVYLDTPKNGHMRTVYVGPDTLNLLMRLRQEQTEQNGESAWVFTRDDSTEVMNPKSVSFFFKGFSARCGIEKLHPHQLRHSFASVSIAGGADVASVAEIMGHSDKSITLRVYTHSNRDHNSQVAQNFRDAILGKNGQG